ncbi:cysteine hydrolase family protein [Methylobacterium sp. JK268]
MTKRAILVVDLQNEYLPDGKLPLVGIAEAVSGAAALIADARASGHPVIHVRHENPAGAPVFAAGTAGVGIIPAIRPQEGEAVVVKHFPNAFRETGLQALLDAGGIEEVVIVGAMSHMCIDATARAAADLGYATLVAHDACATRDIAFGSRTVAAADVHAAFMAALGLAYGRVVPVRDILAAGSADRPDHDAG